MRHKWGLNLMFSADDFFLFVFLSVFKPSPVRPPMTSISVSKCLYDSWQILFLKGCKTWDPRELRLQVSSETICWSMRDIRAMTGLRWVRVRVRVEKKSRKGISHNDLFLPWGIAAHIVTSSRNGNRWFIWQPRHMKCQRLSIAEINANHAKCQKQPLQRSETHCQSREGKKQNIQCWFSGLEFLVCRRYLAASVSGTSRCKTDQLDDFILSFASSCVLSLPSSTSPLVTFSHSWNMKSAILWHN